MPVETRNMSTEKAEKQLTELNTNVEKIQTNISQLRNNISTLTGLQQTAIITKITKHNDFQKYNGNTERGFWTYLENLHKAQLLNNLGNEQMRALALALAMDSAYDWIKRYIADHYTISWD